MVSLGFVFGLLLLLYQGVYALRSIIGSQGKFTKKQSRKANVYLYISILISHLETNHIV